MTSRIDRYLDPLGENVERLTEARLDEFAHNQKELTSTLLALREQSVVHHQLKRIASHLRSYRMPWSA